MIRITNTLLWLTLVVLAGAMVTAAVSAAAVFTTLPKMPMRLQEYAGFPSDQHGLLAAGLVMDKVFAVVNAIVWIGAPAACALMILTSVLMQHSAGKISRVVACLFIVATSAVMLMYQALQVPKMNEHLQAYRAAAAEGDIDTAKAEHDAFSGLHNMADVFFQVSAGTLVLGIVCWAWGSPAVKPNSHSANPS